MKKLLLKFVNTLEPAETYTHTHTHTHTCNPCQIKKQIGTICLMLFSLFISPTFATEINDPATCDSGTLSTDTGPTNLRANYESNVLNLKWYDDSGNQLTVPTESNTCTYGNAINLPTPPEKRGYTFKGWKVAIYDFSTFDTDIGCAQERFNKSSMVWYPTFTYGQIIGKALCSVTRGSFAGVGTPDEGHTGSYCWCKATAYKDATDNITYQPNASLPWVWVSVNGADSACLDNCPYYCSNYFCHRPEVRRAVFGITQQ